MGLKSVFWILIGFFVSFSIGLSRFASALPMQVRLATSADSEPYNYQCAEPGGVCGFEIDLFNAICSKMNMVCSWQIVEWRDASGVTIFDKLLSPTSAFDGVVAAAEASEVRRQKMLFSASYFSAKHLFVGQAGKTIEFDDQGYPSVSQVLKIGTWTGYLMEQLKLAYPSGTGKVELIEVSDPIQAVKDGVIDLAFVFTGLETILLRDPAYARYGRLLDVVQEDPFGGVGVAFRISESGRKIEQALSNGLVKIRKDGTYLAISKKWFGHDIWDCQLGPKINDPSCVRN